MSFEVSYLFRFVEQKYASSHCNDLKFLEITDNMRYILHDLVLLVTVAAERMEEFGDC